MRVESPRGAIEAPARIGEIRPGVVFVPFHYGYWDRADAGPGDAAGRAANELTITAWDPVSKQPIFKIAAVAHSQGRADVHLAHYLGLLHRAESELARRVPARSPTRTATSPTCTTVPAARRSSADAHAERLAPFVEPATARRRTTSPSGCTRELFAGTRSGPLGAAARPARPLPDGDRVRHLLDARRPGRAGRARPTSCSAVVQACEGETATQLKWLRTRMKQAAPQALVVAR